MTHYPSTVERVTSHTLPFGETPYTVATYIRIGMSVNKDGKPVRVEETIVRNSKERGRGKWASFLDGDHNTRLVKIETFLLDEDAVKKAREEGKETRINDKKLNAEAKKAEKAAAREAKKAETAARRKAKLEETKEERAAKAKEAYQKRAAEKKAAEDAEMIEKGLVDAEGKPLSKKSAEYRALTGTGRAPKPKNHALLTVPRDETDHTKYIPVNRREHLEDVVHEGDHIFIANVGMFQHAAAQFEHRISGIFRGFTTTKVGNKDVEVAQVEVILRGKKEVTAVKRGGIYVKLTDKNAGATLAG